MSLVPGPLEYNGKLTGYYNLRRMWYDCLRMKL